MTDFYLHPFFWILGFTLLLQIYVYLFVFRRLAAFKTDHTVENKLQPVSVIICAKNEEMNLRENLPVILEQDYPQFEVIVVNDQSEDMTGEALEELAAQYPNLKVITIAPHINEFAGKKFALTLAFKAAKHDVFLLTDADCKPRSGQWIKLMMNSYEGKETDIVLGYSPYAVRPGFLNLFIQFDTVYTAMQYLSFAVTGKPYMGVGRNLSYRKSLFFDNKGFAPYLKLASGDDDLFVNNNASATNTRVQLNPDSFMESAPETSMGYWLKQKRRHMVTGKFYRKADKQRLGFITLSNFLFYVALVAALFDTDILIPVASVFALRLIIQMVIFYLVLKKLKGLRILPMVPILDILYQLVYLPFMGLAGIFGRRRRGW